MRTTVTLDPDVERLLREVARRTHKSFKQTLNQAIRQGLAGSVPSVAKPFKVRSRQMGLKSGIDPAGLNRLADELEVDAFLAQAPPETSSDS